MLDPFKALAREAVALADKLPNPQFFGFKLGCLTGSFKPTGALDTDPKRVNVVGVQAHRRLTGSLNSQGFGVLQVNNRHLLWIGSFHGHVRICAGFVWLKGRYA